MLLLQNDRLTVEIAQVGELYTASRFDWAGIVRQVTLDKQHTFLSQESAAMTKDKAGGIGIIGSFEPAPACFLQHCDYEALQESSQEVLFKGEAPGVACQKRLRIEQNRLLLTCTLHNTGKKSFAFGEYNHNFMLIDGHAYGPEYALHFSFLPELTGKKEGHYNRLNLQEKTLVVTEAFGEPPEDALTQIAGFGKEQLPCTWELTHVPTGLFVREQDRFPIWKYQFWCRSDTVCSEIFVRYRLNPGECATWERIYTFGKKQEDME